MKRKVVIVDLNTDNRFDELTAALAEPKAKIISSAEADNKIVYIIESPK